MNTPIGASDTVSPRGRREARRPEAADPPETPGVAGPGVFAALTWIHILNDMLASYLPGVLPYLALQRQTSLAWASALMTMVLIGQTLQPLTGAWADRAGGRAFILAGPSLAALGAVALSLGPSDALLAATLLLAGLGTTLFHPQALTAARTVLARRVGAGMSGFLIGGEVGRALGPLIAGLIVARLGAGHLWLLALPLALSSPWIWRSFPRLPPRHQPAAAVEWRSHLRPMTALVLYGSLRAGAIYAVSTFLPILWHEQGGSLVASASLVTTLVGIGVVGNFCGGAAADRFGRRLVLTAASALGGLLLASLLAVHGIWLWPILGGAGIALFATGPVTIPIGQDIFAENPAVGSGVALGLTNGLGALMLLPLGLASTLWGIDVALWIAVGMVVTTLLFVRKITPPMGFRPQTAV